MTPHHIGSGELTFEIIEELLAGERKLVLTEEVAARIQHCRDYLDNKMATQKEPIYGITTGFGSLCNKTISEAELTTLQENLVKSHACSIGTEVAPEVVRLMLLLKAHALSLGYSGVQVETVQRIVDFYNAGVLPVVYDRGSLGASGDLAPLANLFLPLIGEGEVRYKGEKREAAEVLKELGMKTITLKCKEGLALLNGTQFMSSHGVLALLHVCSITPLTLPPPVEAKAGTVIIAIINAARTSAKILFFIQSFLHKIGAGKPRAMFSF